MARGLQTTIYFGYTCLHSLPKECEVMARSEYTTAFPLWSSRRSISAVCRQCCLLLLALKPALRSSDFLPVYLGTMNATDFLLVYNDLASCSPLRCPRNADCCCDLAVRIDTCCVSLSCSYYRSTIIQRLYSPFHPRRRELYSLYPHLTLSRRSGNTTRFTANRISLTVIKKSRSLIA